MVKSYKFPYNRSDRPEDLLFGLITSILLHIILFLGSSYWLRAFAPKQKQEISQPIPIEYVQVPPNKTSTPPETSRRAANDSVAGGKAKLERPVSAVKSASPSAPKASASSPKDLPGTKPAEAFLQELTQPTAVSPRSPQKSQPKPRKIAVAPATIAPAPKPRKMAVAPATIPPEPKPRKIAVAPATIPPEPKPLQTAVAPATIPPEPKPLQTVLPPAPIPPEPKPQKIVVAPAPIPPEPKPLQTAQTPTTTPPAPKPHKIAVAPTTTPPEPKPLQTALPPATTPPVPKPHKIAVAPTTTSPEPKPQKIAVPLTPQEHKSRVAAKSTSGQLATKATPRTQSQIQPSLKSGAASRLGGPISLSSRDLGGNYLAALPNSNRIAQAREGIDARQDTDLLGPYLEQLRQKVMRQWIPELTQSSRQTVLIFTVSRSGQISNLQVEQSSGFKVTDEQAYKAVKRAAPFAPLPTTYAQNYINIEFTFTINIYGQLDLEGGGY